MEENPVTLTSSEMPPGINSLLAAGDIECDKCGAAIKHLDRYCCNSRECSACGAIVEAVTHLEGHFSQQHPGVPTRGTRYCTECSLKAGYLKTVKNRKTDAIFPAMFVLRDEMTLD